MRISLWTVVRVVHREREQRACDGIRQHLGHGIAAHEARGTLLPRRPALQHRWRVTIRKELLRSTNNNKHARFNHACKRQELLWGYVLWAMCVADGVQ